MCSFASQSPVSKLNFYFVTRFMAAGKGHMYGILDKVTTSRASYWVPKDMQRKLLENMLREQEDAAKQGNHTADSSRHHDGALSRNASFYSSHDEAFASTLEKVRPRFAQPRPRLWQD